MCQHRSCDACEPQNSIRSFIGVRTILFPFLFLFICSSPWLCGRAGAAYQLSRDCADVGGVHNKLWGERSVGDGVIAWSEEIESESFFTRCGVGWDGIMRWSDGSEKINETLMDESRTLAIERRVFVYHINRFRQQKSRSTRQTMSLPLTNRSSRHKTDIELKGNKAIEQMQML